MHLTNMGRKLTDSELETKNNLLYRKLKNISSHILYFERILCQIR